MNLFQRYVRRLLGRGRKRHFTVTPPVRQIKQLFKKHPIIMNSVTYGFLCTSAELSVQTMKIVFSKDRSINSTHLKPTNDKAASTNSNVMKYDFSSVKRLAVWGTMVIPPIFHVWYKWLEQKFPPCKVTGVRTNVTIMKKCILDQFFFTPPLLILFFGGMAGVEYLQSRNYKTEWKNVWEEMKSEALVKVPKVFIADCLFWMPTMAVNFKYVPPTYRILFIGGASFIWLNVLCFAKTYQF